MQNHPNWKNELALLASIIRKAPLEVAIKWGAEVFCFHGKNVVSYGGFNEYVALWFYNGVFLNDPLGVLLNAQEGKTKSLRQWRFTSIEAIHEEEILPYILEAIEVAKKGLKIQSAKPTELILPKALASALQHDAPLQSAFYQLSAGRQREYATYLHEAKQEKTQVTRLEKIIPMILQGIGLNDKYKK